MGVVSVKNKISKNELEELRTRMGESSPEGSIDRLKLKVMKGASTLEDLKLLGVPMKHLPQRYEEAAVGILKRGSGVLPALENGAAGLILVGGGDWYRGAMAAALAARKASNRWNATRTFIDVPELIDKVFSLPLYGADSRSALLAGVKSADILVLHGLDELVERPKGSSALEEILRERARTACGYTIVTSELEWSSLKRRVTDRIRMDLVDLLVVPSAEKLNCVSLSGMQSAQSKGHSHD